MVGNVGSELLKIEMKPDDSAREADLIIYFSLETTIVYYPRIYILGRQVENNTEESIHLVLGCLPSGVMKTSAALR